MTRLHSFGPINRTECSGLLIGNGSADVAIRRSGRQVVVDVMDRHGNVQVLTIA
ncbi:hypothetical protein [Rhizobium leguminosarum]|uniref:hypothetical protein n=1 Tax=Rhizobium leguminosarum TaxID=384 RepID=UPI001C98BE21|nr:hypothetical protein [Rhizobium leguminosarum]MBY5644913.1 hypothetical protein [Rhizobium leguminosarum]